MILMLNIHYSHASRHHRAGPGGHRAFPPGDALSRHLRQLVQPHRGAYRRDPHSHRRARATAAQMSLLPRREQTPVELLPDDTLVFLLGSRYCETDRLSSIAWQLFGNAPPGWGRVQAICDFVHDHITFGYQYARPTRTAWEAYQERVGVCRDFAHLAVTFCRCMNIPARYCTGYLGDIGVPPSAAPMDFSGWFEAYLGGRWYTFDARHKRRASAAS